MIFSGNLRVYLRELEQLLKVIFFIQFGRYFGIPPLN